jgi:Penicillin V acylase and related amidases
MCTAITLQSIEGESFLGRTLDFSYELQPHFYTVPRNYQWVNAVTGEPEHDIYSFIGIGQKVDGVLGFIDGVNEHGFAAAVLYFAGYASYDTAEWNQKAKQVASYDVLHYILGSCASVEDFCAQVNHIQIVGVTDPLTQTVAPLHWIVTDRSGECIVLELTERGAELFSNPMGVLSNSPDLRWHMTNLRNYIDVTPGQIEEADWNSVRLTPFGQAGGTVAMPGGFTSPERFVRTAYLKSHIPHPKSSGDAIYSFFQIMKSVSIPKGAVVTSRGTDDYTQYTALIDTNSRGYFYNTYENLQIKKVSFRAADTSSSELIDLGEIIRPMTFESFK